MVVVLPFVFAMQPLITCNAEDSWLQRRVIWLAMLKFMVGMRSCIVATLQCMATVGNTTLNRCHFTLESENNACRAAVSSGCALSFRAAALTCMLAKLAFVAAICCDTRLSSSMFVVRRLLSSHSRTQLHQLTRSLSGCSLTETVDLIWVFFTPQYGLTSVMEVSIDLGGPKDVRVDVKIRYLTLAILGVWLDSGKCLT